MDTVKFVFSSEAKSLFHRFQPLLKFSNCKSAWYLFILLRKPCTFTIGFFYGWFLTNSKCLMLCVQPLAYFPTVKVRGIFLYFIQENHAFLQLAFSTVGF